MLGGIRGGHKAIKDSWDAVKHDLAVYYDVIGSKFEIGPQFELEQRRTMLAHLFSLRSPFKDAYRYLESVITREMEEFLKPIQVLMFEKSVEYLVCQIRLLTNCHNRYSSIFNNAKIRELAPLDLDIKGLIQSSELSNGNAQKSSAADINGDGRASVAGRKYETCCFTEDPFKNMRNLDNGNVYHDDLEPDHIEERGTSFQEENFQFQEP